MNPFLSAFNTPFEAAPFDVIRPEHFIPAIDQAIAQAKKEIDQIVEDKEAPSFDNTLVRLEFSGALLNRISSVFFNLNSAETNEEIQKLAQEISPKLSEFANDIRLNDALFKKIDTVYQSRNDLDLDKEDQMLLEKNYKAFARNGAHLNIKDKDRLRTIDKNLSTLSLKFGEHVLAETNAYQMHLTDSKDLSGLPEGVKEAARALAESKEMDGWLITLDYPSYVPFMTYAENRDLRKQLSYAFATRANKGNENDNKQIILDIIRLRHDRAQLLGYDSHAHFTLEERMAETPEKVYGFLEELLLKAKPAAQREYAKLEHLAKKDGIDVLQKWDANFYSEKLKKMELDLEEEQLKPYFSLDKVLDGVFEIAGELFGLNFSERQDIPVYHEEVKTYDVQNESGEHVALFYADFFPRKGKRNGAWMTSYKSQWTKDGINSRPHISIVCNFTKPTPTKPSLLTFNEVTTLFHEFGHALHGMLANTKYPNLSGTSVYWDFVELPSQIFENWCYEKEAIERFAHHYESGEPIPMELIEKIKQSANFLEGLATLRQLSFGLLDMGYHNKDAVSITSVEEYEKKAFASTRLYPEVEGHYMSTAFSHIFQGGYSSGYYSYKWAEVLDADAFEAFKEEGIFNRQTATRFKDSILSQGGTQKPMELYKQFRGKKPDVNALLRRAGLI